LSDATVGAPTALGWRARAGAAAQIAIVVAGTYALVGVVEHFGLGAGDVRRSLLAHVAIIGGGALVLVALALAHTPNRLHALGLGRRGVAFVLGTGLLGACATYAIQAVAVVLIVTATGGLATQTGMAEQKVKAFNAFASVPLWQIAPLALGAGFYEEVVFRGFLLGRLHVVLGSAQSPRRTQVLAVALSSALFGAGHLYQGGLGVAQTFIAGACLATIVIVTRSLWPAIVAHALIDGFGLVAVRYLAPAAEKALEHLQNAPR